MRAAKARLALVVFVLAIAALPGAASARVHVSIGFGTHIGGYYGPYHGWYGGWHRGYRPFSPRYWHPYGSIWMYDYDPIFIGPPVVERHVIVEKPAPPAPPAEPVSAAVSEAQQQKRSELLERLRIGDEDNRLQAANDLTGFTGDEKVRAALEQALLKDSDENVRAAAAKALVKQSGSKAVPALKQAYAQDSSRHVQQAAYKGLIMIEGY
jgi:hypothetical protein